MHWIGVGILIWIGVQVAPAIIGLICWLLPGAFGAVVGALFLGLLTQSAQGALIGAAVGGIGLHILIWRSDSI